MSQLYNPPTVKEPRSLRRTLAYTAAMLFVLAATSMWAYAFFFATRHSPDKVPDRAWASSAQTVCLDTKGRIDALPVAGTFRKIEPLTEALRQRALVLDQANDILAEQITRIRAQVPADAETARITGEWLADWDVYLEDRRVHSLELKAGKDVPFTERTHKESPMSNRMNAFARVNEMPRCQTPQDLA